MRKTIQVIINLFMTVFIFIASLSLVAIGNIAQVFRGLLKDLGSEVPLATNFVINSGPYLVTVGYIGAGISLAAFIIWTILLIKSKAQKYLLDTADATAIVLIVWIIGAFKLSIIYYSLYQPMFNVINLIKD